MREVDAESDYRLHPVAGRPGRGGGAAAAPTSRPDSRSGSAARHRRRLAAGRLGAIVRRPVPLAGADLGPGGQLCGHWSALLPGGRRCRAVVVSMVTLSGQSRRLRCRADLTAPRRSRHEPPPLRPELALQLAKQDLQYSSDVLEDRVRAVYYPLKAQVRRHPFAVLMVAVGVGAVAGSITDRRDL